MGLFIQAILRGITSAAACSRRQVGTRYRSFWDDKGAHVVIGGCGWQDYLLKAEMTGRIGPFAFLADFRIGPSFLGRFILSAKNVDFVLNREWNFRVLACDRSLLIQFNPCTAELFVSIYRNFQLQMNEK